jgi:hypothetical protein
MKKLSIIGLFLLAVISFNSCSSDDGVVFTTPNNSVPTFTNSFLSEYVLIPQASGNLAERFTWNSVTTDVPTNITYTLNKSITGDTDADGNLVNPDVVGATTGNEIAITIGDMLGYAAEAGLDNDPNTENPDSGPVYFQLVSSLGTEDGLPNASDIITLTMVLPEIQGPEEAVCDFDGYFMVGSGVKFTGWDWATPQFAACSGTNVYTVNVDLLSVDDPDSDGNFRFFTANNNWDSGINYPGFIEDGYTIDDRFEDAMDGDNNFLFTGESGKYLLTIDAVNKTITLADPAPQGTCEFDQMWAVGAGLPDSGWDWATPQQFMCESDGVYQGWSNFTNEGDANFRFFTANNNWDSGLNYPYFEGEGYTIDELLVNAGDGDSNFQFIGEMSGKYFVTIDTVNKTITLE